MWGEDDESRYITTNFNLQVYRLELAVAWKPAKDISIATSIFWNFSYLGLEKINPSFLVDGSQQQHPYDTSRTEITGFAFDGVGYSLSLYYILLDEVAIGLLYRHRTILHYNIESEKSQIIQNNQVVDEQESNQIAYEGANHSGHTTIYLPATLAIGLSYFYTDNLMFEADLVYNSWSGLKDISLHFDNPTLDGYLFDNILLSLSDSLTFLLGANYNYKRDLKLRAGIGLDLTPLPETSLTPISTDSTKVLITAGATMNMGKMKINGAAIASIFIPRTSTQNYLSFTAGYVSISPISVIISVDYPLDIGSKINNILRSLGVRI